MKRVYKYPIPIADQEVTIQFPKGYEIRAFGHQSDPATVLVWAEVDADEEELVEQTFFVVGTGHDIERDDLEFCATVNIWMVGLVWHVYTVRKA